MKFIRYSYPLNQTLTELSDWFRDSRVDFEPVSRFLEQRLPHLPHLPLQADRSELPADFYEAEGHYAARFHLPGIQKEKLQVQIEPNAELVVGFDRKDPAEGRPEATNRRITLPQDADPTTVEAKFEDGVLTVTVGKKEQAKPRTIEVK